MTTMMEKLRTIFSPPQETEQNNRFWESFDDATTLTRTQRFYGFCISLGTGIVFCFISMWFILIPATFAVLYTLGIIAFVSSTFFLMGPWNQLKNMMTQQRLPASICFLAMIVLTLWAAFGLENVIAVLIFFILQMIALGWYVLSYLPYGQQAAGNFLSSVFT